MIDMLSAEHNGRCIKFNVNDKCLGKQTNGTEKIKKKNWFALC